MTVPTADAPMTNGIEYGLVTKPRPVVLEIVATRCVAPFPQLEVRASVGGPDSPECNIPAAYRGIKGCYELVPFQRYGALTRKAGVAPPHGATPASTASAKGLGELEAFTPALTRPLGCPFSQGDCAHPGLPRR